MQEATDDRMQARIDALVERLRKLSGPQLEVLKHVSSGKDNHEIARHLNVPISTIMGRLAAIYDVAQIPKTVTSRNEKREIIAGMYRALTNKYVVNEYGRTVLRPEPVAKLPTAPPIPQTPAAAEPQAEPLTNGHAPDAKPIDTKPQQPATAPAKVTPGYGVGLMVPLPDPTTISDIATVTLGTPEATERLHTLLGQGYLPEVMNDFQSLTGMRQVTRIVLIKRR